MELRDLFESEGMSRVPDVCEVLGLVVVKF